MENQRLTPLILFGVVMGIFGCHTTRPSSEQTAATTQALGEAGAPSTERRPPPSQCSSDACAVQGKECGLISQGLETLDCGDCASDSTCENGTCVPIPCVPDGKFTLSCAGNNLVQTDSCGVTTLASECPYGCVDAACVEPRCGDGSVQNDEECDDANDVDNDACSNSCVRAICGDGVVQTMEVCDDGNTNDGDTCDATCQREFKYAFVTSEVYTGDLGGLAGADAKCQSLAGAAGLPGTYFAWLSTASESPSKRFAKSASGYITKTGVIIADSWADLTNGTLDAPLNVTELGTPAPPSPTSRCAGEKMPVVRTSTFFNGTPYLSPFGQYFCGDWTTTVGGSLLGLASETSSNWSIRCGSSSNCDVLTGIYCFQQ